MKDVPPDNAQRPMKSARTGLRSKYRTPLFQAKIPIEMMPTTAQASPTRPTIRIDRPRPSISFDCSALNS